MNKLMRFKKIFARVCNSPMELIRSLVLYAYIMWMIKSEDVRSDLENWVYKMNEKMRD